jgi:exodeoxyribonuclease VII large subunit
MTSEQRKVYKVAELTRLIRMLLEDHIGAVWVEGEVSNLRTPSSGHMYFTLKDESSQIAAVLFRGSQRGVKVAIRDGIKLRVFGNLSVYDKSGQYQIVVQQAEEAGKGSLQEAFEKLKAKLAAEGLFDAERKRPLPLLPRHVGVVTSPTGAAIKDILNILGRRFPNLHVLIAPVRVQGEGAAKEIAEAIELLNRRTDIEVMIVGRGGGSLEDLWCFNEEVVARAIAASRIPVISAVGHEIDFTISDFVADLRAPTPSAAAELVVGQKESFEEALRQMRLRLAQALRHSALEMRNRLTRVSRSYVFREPQNLIRQYVQRLDHLRVKMAHELIQGARDAQSRIKNLAVRLQHGMDLRRKAVRQDVQRLSAQLTALSPVRVLERGFSITRGADGRIVRRAGDVAVGTELVTQLAAGKIRSNVKTVEEGGSDGGKAK